MKEREGRKSCERNYSKTEECLIYTWAVKVECKAKCVCFCDKNGYESFIWRKNTGERVDLPLQSFCFTLCFYSCWRTTNNNFSQFPLATALSPSFDNIILLGDSHFDLHSFEKRMNSMEGTGGELVVSLCGLPWVDSQPVFNSAVGRQWANVQTNANYDLFI